MNIENHFEGFKTWAENQDILLVEALFDINKYPVVDVSSSENNTLPIFQKIIEKFEAKVIVCDILRFDKTKFNEHESIINLDEFSEVREMFERMRHYNGKILGYGLMIFKEGVSFRFSEYAEESGDFLDVENAVLDYEYENNSEDARFKTISEEKASELGNQLAEHENYSKLKNRTQRVNFAKTLFKMEFEKIGVSDFYDVNLIVSNAEGYYETTIKPQKEKELKTKILELIDKGWTKVKIAAHLGISKDILNKYI